MNPEVAQTPGATFEDVQFAPGVTEAQKAQFRQVFEAKKADNERVLAQKSAKLAAEDERNAQEAFTRLYADAMQEADEADKSGNGDALEAQIARMREFAENERLSGRDSMRIKAQNAAAQLEKLADEAGEVRAQNYLAEHPETRIWDAKKGESASNAIHADARAAKFAKAVQQKWDATLEKTRAAGEKENFARLLDFELDYDLARAQGVSGAELEKMRSDLWMLYKNMAASGNLAAPDARAFLNRWNGRLEDDIKEAMQTFDAYFGLSWEPAAGGGLAAEAKKEIEKKGRLTMRGGVDFKTENFAVLRDSMRRYLTALPHGEGRKETIKRIIDKHISHWTAQEARGDIEKLMQRIADAETLNDIQRTAGDIAPYIDIDGLLEIRRGAEGRAARREAGKPDGAEEDGEGDGDDGK